MFSWVIAGSLIVGAPALKDERKPAKPPAGRWTPTRTVMEGKEFQTNEQGPSIWEFTADSRKVSCPFCGRTTQRAAYFVRGGTLEFDLDEGPEALRAIWKIDGDTLTVCFGTYGGDRPTDFTAVKGSGRVLVTLKRIDPTAPVLNRR